MRTDDPGFLDTVTATTRGDRLTGTVWRGDAEPVPVDITSWSLGWDADRQVQGQASLEIADPDGTLMPWGYGDTLAPGGSVVALAWESGSTGLRVPMGMWRIRRPTGRQQWRVYDRGSSVVRVPGGGSVAVAADELTAAAMIARLDAVPGPTKPTALAEAAHLLEGIMALTAPGVVDAPAPRVTYGESRMDAVEAMLAALGAVHRMGPDGSLEVLTPSTDPVWTIEGGAGGALVDLEVSLSDEGVYNAATSTSQTPSGSPLVGRAYLDSGPLAYGGPFGQVPLFHASPATTRAGVDADAATLLANRARNAEVVVPVECLTNPALQPHDVVTVVAPTIGGDAPLTGRVVAMQMVSAGGEQGVTPAKRMTLGVAVSVEVLEVVSRRASRAR